MNINHKSAEIVQLGERQTEDLNVWFNPGFRKHIHFLSSCTIFFLFKLLRELVGQETENTNFSDELFISILKNYSISFVANAHTI